MISEADRIEANRLGVPITPDGKFVIQYRHYGKWLETTAIRIIFDHICRNPQCNRTVRPINRYNHARMRFDAGPYCSRECHWAVERANQPSLYTCKYCGKEFRDDSEHKTPAKYRVKRHVYSCKSSLTRKRQTGEILE